ncbi:hypothetical protein MauCBS54593_000433 [Microsporum audouinii]
MYISSLVVITLYAFVTSICAAPAEYTLITSKQHGLNLTFNDYLNTVGFESGSFDRHWVDVPVTNGVKNWHCYRAKQYPQFDWLWIRFYDPKSGEVARTPKYNNPPSIFNVETVRDVSYLISLETTNTNQQLAWTIERNTTSDQNFVLKLRPYTRSPSQEFIITQELGDDLTGR